MRSAHTTLLAILAAAASTFAARAQDDQTNAAHEVLLRDLRVSVGVVIRADSDGIEWIEQGGIRRKASASEVLGLATRLAPLRSAQAPLDMMSVAPGATGIIELTDGQRFPGERLQAEDAGESIAWRHPMFGRMSFPLDNVRRAGFDTAARERIERNAARNTPKDAAWLANGDALEGFLIALNERVVFQTDAGEASAPTDRVAGLALTSPATVTRGPRYWLDEGSVCSVSSAVSAGAGWTSLSLPTGQSVRIPMNSVRAMLMDAGVITPLSALPEPSVAPVGDRDVLDGVRILPATATPAWNAYDIELGGPLSVTWVLPAGALRFSAVIELPLSTQRWGDCDIVVLLDGEPAWKGRLSPDEPSARIAMTAAGRRLTIEVRPGAHGAVNDRPVLRRAIVVLSEPEA